MVEDVHSFARPAECRVTHLDLDLTADFERRVLSGRATLTLAGPAPRVMLDTDGLTIHAVEDEAGRPLPFSLGERHPALGTPLAIERGAAARVAIRYETAEDAAALLWLEPAQTASGKPFLFTQGQAILTRSWIPCQDTPGVRMTYSATLEVPAGLVGVMAAHAKDREGEPSPGGRRFSFELPYPIPSYLVALAAGALEYHDLGPRSGVWAEPSVVELAAAEFQDVEAMIDAAERLYGPYRWGRYEVLVLPPSFPFGGMENPCLTFVTPTILAGDRSLVALVAHELAHSWSGNLVTNATWSDLWLNEGFTVYFERRIMEELKGRRYVDMLRVLGWQDLTEDLVSLGNGPDTRLHVDVDGRNPDDAFSNVPYEKGALFLEAIERAVGRERFDAFLRGYFDAFAFQPMTAERFTSHLRERLFPGKDGAAALAELDVPTWLHGQGLPEDVVRPESEEFRLVLEARDRFVAGAPAAEMGRTPAGEAWTTHHWLHFLRNLPPEQPAARRAELEREFGFARAGNAEIRFEWLRIGVRERDPAIVAPLEEFLVAQGRRKFLKPLYQDLVKSDWGRPHARRIFERARPGYHAVSANTIEQVLAKGGA